MKRLIALLLAMMLCIPMAAVCAEEEASMSYAKLVEMAQYTRQIASGDYMAMNGVPEDVQRTAREWAAGLDGEPRLVVRMNVLESSFLKENRAAFVAEHPMVAYEAESTAMAYILSYLMMFAATESVVAESAYEEIAEVNDQLNCSMLFAEENAGADGMYLLLYENAKPLLVLACCENGAVSLRSFFIPSPQLAKCTNHGQVALWLMRYGFSITCTEVPAE